MLIFILEEKQARQEKAFLVKVHTLNTVSHFHHATLYILIDHSIHMVKFTSRAIYIHMQSKKSLLIMKLLILLIAEILN